jgi:hypothetical protein
VCGYYTQISEALGLRTIDWGVLEETLESWQNNPNGNSLENGQVDCSIYSMVFLVGPHLASNNVHKEDLGGLWCSCSTSTPKKLAWRSERQ